MKRVVIVDEEKSITIPSLREEYDDFIRLIREILKGAEKTDSSGKKEKEAVIELAESIEVALLKLQYGEVDVLVFVSRRMIYQAKMLKARYPRLRIVLFTGSTLEEELIVVKKGGQHLTKEIIIHAVLD